MPCLRLCTGRRGHVLCLSPTQEGTFTPRGVTQTQIQTFPFPGPGGWAKVGGGLWASAVLLVMTTALSEQDRGPGVCGRLTSLQRFGFTYGE